MRKGVRKMPKKIYDSPLVSLLYICSDDILTTSKGELKDFIPTNPGEWDSPF